MPIYTYQCDECGEEHDETLKMADRDSLVGTKCEFCRIGNLHRIPTAVRANGFTTSESLGRIKAPAEFRELLSNIKKNHPGSVINER